MRVVYAVLLSLLCFTGCTTTNNSGNQVQLPQPGQSFTDMTASGAWCWFADPRAVYNKGKHSRSYIGWIDQEGDIHVGMYDHDTQQFSEAGSPLHERVMRENGRPDDHSNPSILILQDGRLAVFYSPHSGSPMWYRISSKPEDISAWGEEHTIPVNTEGNHGWTYPNPWRLPAENDRIFLFWRGGNYNPNFTTSEDCLNWNPVRTLIMGGENVRPYMKIISNYKDQIHFAFTDGHPRNEAANSIYHAYYQNGAVFQTDGTRIASLEELPIAPEQATRVYDGHVSTGRGWIWDIALDAAGRPVIVYASCPEETDHRYRYARWDGTSWIDHEITAAGPWFPQTQSGEKEREPHYSGGIILDHGNPNTVFLSRQVNGIFEIEQWTTGDNGQHWESIPITAGSSHNNVRPVTVRHPGPDRLLFWMHGNYIHFTNYQTGIKMLNLSR